MNEPFFECVGCGTGLKYPPVLKQFFFSPLKTDISQLTNTLETALK